MVQFLYWFSSVLTIIIFSFWVSVFASLYELEEIIVVILGIVVVIFGIVVGVLGIVVGIFRNVVRISGKVVGVLVMLVHFLLSSSFFQKLSSQNRHSWVVAKQNIQFWSQLLDICPESMVIS